MVVMLSADSYLLIEQNVQNLIKRNGVTLEK
jgi:hypothetical protein